MTKEFERQLKRYITKVKEKTICPKSAKIDFINSFISDVYDYVEANNIEHIQQIVEHFGTPENIANYMISTLTDEEIIHAKRHKRMVTFYMIAAIVAAFAVTLFCVYTVFMSIGYNVNYLL